MRYVCFRLHSVDDYYRATERLAHEQVSFKKLDAGYEMSLLVSSADAKRAESILQALGVNVACTLEETDERLRLFKD